MHHAVERQAGRRSHFLYFFDPLEVMNIRLFLQRLSVKRIVNNDRLAGGGSNCLLGGLVDFCFEFSLKSSARELCATVRAVKLLLGALCLFVKCLIKEYNIAGAFWAREDFAPHRVVYSA